MKDPYSVLGIDPSASDDEVKRAYRELARKYHPDNYQDNPLSDLAEEKMKEVNEAYDAITKTRSGGGTSGGYGYQTQPDYSYQSASGGDPALRRAREAVARGNVDEAERILTQEAAAKNGEWYFLMGSVAYRRGWLDEAMQNFQMAVQLDPGNMEYRQAYNRVAQGGNAYQPYGGGQVQTAGCSDCLSTYLCVSCITPWGGPCC